MNLSNLPAGAEHDQNAPWNQHDVPEKDFEIICSQTLSRTATVYTDNYIPGESGADYEPDDEGGYYAVAWHEADDTSNTDWKKEYYDNGYKTPLQLIQILKGYLKDDLKKWEEEDKKEPHRWAATQVRILKGLIEECECWCEDECEFIEN